MEELARIYSRSLFAVADEAGKRDLVREQLAQLADALRGSRDMQLFMFSPHFSTEEKKAGLERALQGADPILLRFLMLLIERHRMPVLERIRQEYEQLCARAEARLAVQITSAVQLDPELAENVAEQIGRHTGMRVDLASRVDPEIIGGLVLRVGNSIIDSSIRTRLERLRREVARAA
jgi:F-type H+-transporting ATPase subunit delta